MDDIACYITVRHKKSAGDGESGADAEAVEAEAAEAEAEAAEAETVAVVETAADALISHFRVRGPRAHYLHLLSKRPSLLVHCAARSRREV